MTPAMPTDKGWAWVVLLASLGNNFLNGALCYFVGVVHTGLLRKYKASVAVTSWTGGLYSSLMSLGAPVASLIIGRLGCRTCCVLGGVFCFVGLSSSAFVTSIYQLFFTYGLIAGTGLCLSYTPTIVTVGYYFDRFRGLASGVSVSATAIGILSGNLIMQSLMEEYSVDGAFLLAGAISLHYCFFGMFFRPTEYEKGKYSINIDEGPDRREDSFFGSKLSLAIHGVEVKLAKSIQSLTREGQEGDEDCSEVPLLKPLAVDAEDCDSLVAERRTVDVPEESPDHEVALATAATEGKQDGACLDLKKSTTSVSHEADDEVAEAGRCEDDKLAQPTHPDCVTRSCKNQYAATRSPQVSSSTGREKAEERAGGSLCSNNTTQVTTDRDGQRASEDNVRRQGHERQRVAKYAECGEASRQSSERQAASDDAANGGIRQQNSEGEGQTYRSNREAYVAVLTNAAFMCYCCSVLASNLTVSGVYLHLPEYLQVQGTSPYRAAQVFVAVGVLSDLNIGALVAALPGIVGSALGLVGPVSVYYDKFRCLVSRLAAGFSTTDQRIDPITINMGLSGLCGLATLLFPQYSDTYGGQVAYSAMFGLYTGGQMALFNSLTVKFVGVRLLNTGFGIVSLFMGLGFIAGPPMAALIVDSGGTYEHSFLFLGCMMEVAFFFNLAAGFFLKTHSPPQEQRGREEEVVINRDVMGSNLVITVSKPMTDSVSSLVV